MNLSRKIPLRVVVGLAAAVLIDTALQIFWKTAVLKLPGETNYFGVDACRIPRASFYRRHLHHEPPVL